MQHRESETVMAEVVSETETQAVKPPPKRRRILDPSAIVPVPVYSNKVSSSLQLKPKASVFMQKENTSNDDSLKFQFPSRGSTAASLTDPDEDEAEFEQSETEHAARSKEPEALQCPSPPPLESPVHKQLRKVTQKISEIDRTLKAVNCLFSQEPQGRRLRCCQDLPCQGQNDDSVVIIASNDDDDIIIVNPLGGSPYSSLGREIPLKIRCRTDIHKIPVMSSAPLSYIVSQLSIILQVPPPRLLLLREEVELPADSTVSELGLGIADIIDCVVIAAEDKSSSIDGSSNITIRLQGIDRDSTQEYSLNKGAPLGSIFSQYVSKMLNNTQRNVHFQFDGVKVKPRQTPAQLDMEDGDIIEVWI